MHSLPEMTSLIGSASETFNAKQVGAAGHHLLSRATLSHDRYAQVLLVCTDQLQLPLCNTATRCAKDASNEWLLMPAELALATAPDPGRMFAGGGGGRGWAATAAAS